MRLLYFPILCSIIIFMSGCSNQDEIIRVGEPTVEESDDGQEYIVEGHVIIDEIKDESNVNDIKEITEQNDRIDQPDLTMSKPPEIFFELYEPNNSVSVFQYYLWSRTDGGAILQDSDGTYFEINEEQAENLKEALE